MKKLQILRVDNDSVQTVDLRIGENLIGRGVTSDSDDDRVVKHAITINVKSENEITLTPIAPCYVKSIDSTRWQLVKLGTTVPLKPGDMCSLVPEKCWFKVQAVATKMESNEENTLKRRVDEDTESVHTKRFCSDSGEGDNVHSSSCHVLHETTDNNGTIEIDEENLSSDRAEDQMQESNGNSMGSTQCTGIGPSTLKETGSSESRLKGARARETSNLALASQENKEDPRSSVQEVQRLEEALSSAVTNVRREKCKYGKDCYRKNPQHKAEFSHVGDPDYDMPDDREECPYGMKCYRKNSDHRQRFKHTVMNKRNERNRQQPRLRATLNNFTDVEDLSGEESVDESVDESEYDPSTDIDSEYELDDESD
ncbi:aprataxin and PNK-like factor isoform X2 [Ceratina calcarata]|uniref:Aprataxin and PNK-like factor isoform X2 n=1 Tax=Ceratina calcarata TaxID=156304 RepID=A0AAJ7NDN8_9HYME|nr:aprataxin and PNK-like factor isoform X2 [Ceratina calcarata]